MSETPRTNDHTALKRAALLTVAMAGGVSALLFSFGGSATTAEGSGQSAIVTEYVDVNGNPIDPTALTGGQAPVVYVDENGMPYDDPQSAAATPVNAGYQAESYEDHDEDGYEEEYEDEDHDDEEYEDYDEGEYDEDEHGDVDYEEGEHDD